MPIAAVIGAAAPIVGGIINSGAAAKAGQEEANAANSATANTRAMYEETKGNLQPFTDVGKSATYTLADLYGLGTNGSGSTGAPFNQAAIDAFENSPDYQFAKQQGINALDASAAAKGGLLSGNQLEAITNYAGGLASQNFNNYASRLMALGQLGESAGAQAGSLGGQAAANEAGTIQNAGQAAAAGTVGSSNALVNGFNQGINNYFATTGSGSAYGPAPGQGGFNNGGNAASSFNAGFNPATASQGMIY